MNEVINTTTLTHVLKSQQPLNPLSKHQKRQHYDSNSSQLNGQCVQFIRTEDKLSESFELIKILKQHQQSNRWILMIAPQNIPDRALLNCCSVNMNQVLVVHEKQISSVLATIENALKHATCSAVIAWSDHWQSQFEQHKLESLRQMAYHSGCHFYGFTKQHNNNQPLTTQTVGCDNHRHH